MSDFATRLKTALSNKGMRPSVLAYKLGVDRSTISNYLNNRYKPKNELTIRISEILGVSPAWLHGIEEKNFSTEEISLTDGERAWLDLYRSMSEEERALFLRRFGAEI
jgi:transcriptional regulator with XRE-family HTH domain